MRLRVETLQTDEVKEGRYRDPNLQNGEHCPALGEL